MNDSYSRLKKMKSNLDDIWLKENWIVVQMASQTYTVHNAVEGIILKVKKEEEEEKEEKKKQTNFKLPQNLQTINHQFLL